MAGRNREVRVTAEASHSLSVEYTVFMKNIAYKSVERHRAKSRSRTPGRRPLGICRRKVLNEHHSQDLRKCWILELRGRRGLWSLILRVAQTSRLQKSSEGVSRWRPGHLFSATSLVALVTCLGSVHLLIVNM
jgi:hypothetical protein